MQNPQAVQAQQELEEEVKALKDIQKEYKKFVDGKTKLVEQKEECQLVANEINLLENDAKVFKMVGSVLTHQSSKEAKQNVQKRLDFIDSELYLFCDIKEKKLTSFWEKMTKDKLKEKISIISIKFLSKSQKLELKKLTKTLKSSLIQYRNRHKRVYHWDDGSTSTLHLLRIIGKKIQYIYNYPYHIGKFEPLKSHAYSPISPKVPWVTLKADQIDKQIAEDMGWDSPFSPLYDEDEYNKDENEENADQIFGYSSYIKDQGRVLKNKQRTNELEAQVKGQQEEKNSGNSEEHESQLTKFRKNEISTQQDQQINQSADDQTDQKKQNAQDNRISMQELKNHLKSQLQNTK